jgi:hypothetical protein
VQFVVVFNGKAVLGTFLPAVNFDDRSFSLSTAVSFAAVSSTVSYDAQSMQVVGFSETKFVVCYTKLTMPNADAGVGVAYVGTAAGASISFSAEQTYVSPLRMVCTPPARDVATGTSHQLIYQLLSSSVRIQRSRPGFNPPSCS